MELHSNPNSTFLFTRIVQMKFENFQFWHILSLLRILRASDSALDRFIYLFTEVLLILCFQSLDWTLARTNLCNIIIIIIIIFIIFIIIIIMLSMTSFTGRSSRHRFHHTRNQRAWLAMAQISVLMDARSFRGRAANTLPGMSPSQTLWHSHTCQRHRVSVALLRKMPHSEKL